MRKCRTAAAPIAHCLRPQPLLKSNKVTMWESLNHLFEDMPEINIDFVVSLKDWYLDALDNTFGNSRSGIFATSLYQFLRGPIEMQASTQDAHDVSVTETLTPVALIMTHPMTNRNRMRIGHNTMCLLLGPGGVALLLKAARSATGLKRMLEKYCMTH